MAVDWEAVRREFPALAGWTFLNTATFGQLPRRGKEAICAHLERRDRLACSDFMEWFEDLDQIREQIARLIHCQPGDVAFIPNTSSALSLLLGGIDWKPGDRILTFRDEFPNHYYYPSFLARRGVVFDEVDYDRFYDSLTPRTRVAAFSTVGYATGFRAPLEEIAPRLRERGILLCLDGTQSLGALEFDVRLVQPDLFAVHGYKWLISPNGAGFMYVSPAVREWLEPNLIGWRSHRGWRDYQDLHHGAPEFKTEAERYEGGMLPFAVDYAMGAAIEMILEIGPASIERRVLELAEGVRKILRRAGAALVSDLRPHYDSPIVAASFAGRDPAGVARALRSRRVLVAARHGYLRVSPHFYNNEQDLARFEEELERVLVP